MSNILLVEDNLLNQLVIEDAFQFDDLPAKLYCVSSGEEALEAIPLLQPVLILMDLRLPGMSGFEAIDAIRHESDMSGIAIWAVTAHAIRDDDRATIEQIADHYYTKPIDIHTFRSAIREFLDSLPQSSILSPART